MSVKSKVLEILEQNRDQNVSGQQLAEELHVSRTAVWKAIQSLRESGHRITAVTNKGYCLSSDSDVLSPEGIRSYLAQQTKTCRIQVFDTLDSTNSFAKKAALEGADHGTVILADTQTAGRGRLGRAFHSPSGQGLYMSVVLRPQGNIAASLKITVAAAVAVCRGIFELTEIRPEIKWVNDIFLEGKKICGILTEGVSDFESGMIESIVVGIGVNMRSSQEELPTELRDIVGAVNDPALSRNRLAAAIINQLLPLCETLDSEELIEEYKSYSLVLGKNIFYTQNGRQYSGTAIDINREGNLVVQHSNGTHTALRSGEVSLGSRQFLQAGKGEKS